MALLKQHTALEEGVGTLRQQHAALEEAAGWLMERGTAQDAALQLRWDLLVLLMAQKEAAVADNATLTGKLEGRVAECLAWARRCDALELKWAARHRQLRRGFLALCQRWEAAKEEAEAANDRLAEREEEMAALCREKEERHRKNRSVLNHYLANHWMGQH